jgi:hypothetical protein
MRVLISVIVLAGLAACASSGTSSSGASSSGGAVAAVPTSGSTTRRTTTGIENMGRLTITNTVEADVVTVPFDADAVFKILPSLYDSLGVQVNTVDPAKKTVGNSGYKIRNRLGKLPLSMYLDCGGSSQIGPNADSYDVYLSALTSVTPNGAGSAKVGTLVEAQARPATYNQAYSACSSKGLFEQKLAQLISKRLAK